MPASKRTLLLASALSVGCGSPQVETTPPAAVTISEPLPSASAMATPSVVLASATDSAAPLAAASPCRGGRLSFDDAIERCSVGGRGKVLPDVVKAEISGPAEVPAGDEAGYELQLVNRSDNDVSLTLRLTCTPTLDATDAMNRSVIEHENSGGAETVSRCQGKGAVIGVVLEPGGMLVAPVSWRAHSELYRDGELINRQALAPGSYTLRSMTWLSRGGPDEEEKTHGASTMVVGERPVIVR